MENISFIVRRVEASWWGPKRKLYFSKHKQTLNMGMARHETRTIIRQLTIDKTHGKQNHMTE